VQDANPGTFSFWGNVEAVTGPTESINEDPVAPPATVNIMELKALEARVKELEEQMESSRVVMAGVSFTSVSNTSALVTRYTQTPGGRVLLCFCPVGLLAVSTNDQSSLTEILSLEEKSIKVGAASPLEAILSASFRQELPQFFGQISKSVARDDRMLPSIPNYEQWDTQSARTGGRYMMSSGVSSTVDGLSHSLPMNVRGEGLEVSRMMINDSRDFLNQLANWITQTHQDLVNRGGSTKEAWAYVSHCVRAVFALLYKARAPGRGPFLDDSRKHAGMVWGALQCHRVCRELLEANFAGHPTLSHILNLHLRDNAVMNSSMAEVTKRIEDLDTLIKAVRKTAEKALTKK
jgi:hypothetical protein